jgi:hypothetical protein
MRTNSGTSGFSSVGRWWRVIAVVAAGLLACGLPLWRVPYDRVSMPGNPSGTVWLVGGGLAGILGGILLRSNRTPVLSVTTGFVLAVMARVVVETSRDPTTHNLWPFEVVIAGGIGLIAGALGVGITRLAQRL